MEEAMKDILKAQWNDETKKKISAKFNGRNLSTGQYILEKNVQVYFIVSVVVS